MPVSPLPVFLTYEMSDFHIGGNTAEVFDFARRWKIFAENALTCASNLRSISDGGFLGSEGDRYREIINDNFPSHLTTTGNAHNGVSKAVTKYAEALTSAQTRMKALVSVASVNHATVQAAVTRYNACEINVIRAAATAKTLTTTAFATAAVPGVNVATASAASTAQADLASAKVAYEAAKAEYTRAQATFKADLVKGKQIKTALSTEVDSAVFSIRSQAKKRFEENPGWFREQWEKFKDWVGKHADIIGMIADALQLIGGLIAMIPLPVFTAIGATLMGIGVGLKVTLAATGHGSWTSCAFDAVTTFVPGGKLLKAGKNALKGTKTMKTLSKASKAAKGKFKKMASKVSSRGNKCKRPGLEPVDMATGEMINFVTDVHIDGMLPMVVDRNNSSDLDTSMVFGPGWNTTLDCRIEVLSDKILMMSPDGALLEFPTAPADGAEVVANGRPWRLSFVDGAYRVRNIQEGITWVFAVTGSEFGDRRPNAPIQDFTVTGDTPKNYVYLVDGETGEVTHMTRTIEDADLTDGGEHVRAVSNSFVNVLSPGSVADTFGLGVEIYLSSIVHHSGAWIEYDYEQTTGHLVSMRRSDGTTLEFKWHNRIDRLLSMCEKKENPPRGGAPGRLASYNYDGKGRLLKVINSAAGALRYYYDDENRPCRWTDRNGHSYYYRFDEQGRVISQVGSGGMFPNVAVWLPDTGDDAPEDGVVCVALECVGEFHGEPTEIGDSCINEYFDRLDKLPLANLLREKGLVGAGLTGRGRTGVRDDESWTIPDELLHDEFLGDIRPTVYRSTPEGDVWRIIDAEGSIVDREYNQYHQIIRDVSNTGVVTSIDRDEYGTITQIDYGDGTTETITPGAWGEPVRVIGRDGLTTEYELDSAGFITATTYSTGARIEYEYEWRASGLVPLAVIDPQGLVQVTECDNAGRPLASVDPAGRRSSVIRDVRGLVTEIIDPIGNVTKVEYSPEGWVTKVINPDGSEQTMVYDGEGNQIETIDEVGTRTVVKHTVFDKVQEVLAANGGVTRYTYNTQMEPIAITNADGHTWRFEYDLAGNIVKEIDYNGLVTETRRSPDGLRLDTIDGEGTVTTVYDAMGQVTELHEADGVVKFTRDQYGEVTQITNKWSTVDYHHDEYGRLASETTTLYSGEQSALEYHYSAAGAMNAVTHVLPDGREVTETPTYDEHGQLQQMTYGVAGQELASTSFGVDDAGRQSWLSVGSMVRQFKFDQRDRIISDTVMRLGGEAATTNIVDRVFSWRADNALTQVTNNVHNSVTDYTVDVLNHVTGVTHVGAAQDQKSSESYEFSRAGMVTKLHPDASAKWADDVDSYGGTMPRQVGRTTFTYDKAGRVTQTVTKRLSKKPLVKHFYYGSGTQPVGYEDSDHPGVGWRYLYDGLDRRVGKEQINTATGDVLSRTVFMHYGNELFGEQYTVDVNEPHMVGVGALWPVNPITDEILGQIELVPSGSPDSAFYAMISDFAGAPKELVDVTTGGIVGYSKQSLFGKRQWFGGKSSPLLFAGQYEDAESGWVYNRFRYYNTTFGMYNAQDPLGVGPNVASAQAYVDNPTTWVDAMGLAAHKVKSGTPPFVLRAHNKGVVGEHAVDNIIKRSGGKGIGKRVTYVDANGAKRISDGSVGKNLVEVKNVKSQGYSSQIHAAVEKSVERGGKLDLYVARGTKVSPTIRNHPNINLHRIPRRDIVQASKEVFHHPTKTILHY